MKGNVILPPIIFGTQDLLAMLLSLLHRVCRAAVTHFSSFNGQGVAGPREKITCPDCGLVLTAARGVPRYKLSYDVNEWRRCCKRPHLGDPMWCLVYRDGTEPSTNDDGDAAASASSTTSKTLSTASR